MTTITPYLNFAGRCEEALEFYRKTLGAEVDMLMRFNESPEPCPAGQLPPGFESKVMHSSFRIGDIRLMATDGSSEKAKFEGFQLAYSVPNEAEAKRIFEALENGGTVQLALAKTFWSPCFGMLTDRFGLRWMIMVPSPMN